MFFLAFLFSFYLFTFYFLLAARLPPDLETGRAAAHPPVPAPIGPPRDPRRLGRKAEFPAPQWEAAERFPSPFLCDLSSLDQEVALVRPDTKVHVFLMRRWMC